MASTEDGLPLRRDGLIESRPMHVEEWLETLPFADFEHTTQLLHAALTATNQLTLKPATREALLGLYDQPYQYYLQSQIRTGAQHTLSSMENMQRQLHSMQQLAADLALMSQHIINDTQERKSVWGSKPPLRATQQGIDYLSQALIFSYLQYAPPPAGVWQQLHGLYRFAESLELLHNGIKLAGGRTTTIAHSYCSMLLTAVVDPPHLPFGGIWEVHDQLASWLERAELQPYRDGQNAGGLFVVDLDGDLPPRPYNRFDPSEAHAGHRLLDARALYLNAQQARERLRQGETPADLKLSDSYRQLLVEQMVRAWNLPPKRRFPRSPANGKLALTCGLQATHIHMNGGSDLLRQLRKPEPAGADGLDVEGESEDHAVRDDLHRSGNYFALETWDLINKSAGGCALEHQQRPAYSVRVGDLLGLRLTETDAGAYWRLGIIRWLRIEAATTYRIGVQLLGTDCQPVALRFRNRRELQHGFRIRTNDELSLLAGRGQLTANQALDIETIDGRQSVHTRQRIEELAAFEQFTAQPD
ncbi:hypothetical protein J2T55_001928 [Methylohalomonas lacus]|uniref:GTPase n=1 Tax=Methylohalomonas lacus TaxID=398773 RepID=A0AAE3L234_9GAMM|nr:hypothetical protein [Methylohalomonas lacus]MCS3903896.1 hypothetical protein [Methylohalomonas lacus]